MSKAWNKKIFKHIQEHVDQASKDLADERGACPDAADYGFNERFSNIRQLLHQQLQFLLSVVELHQE